MAVIELKDQVLDLTSEAFEAFCDDIAGMFGVEMGCEQKDIVECTVKDLKKKYKKLVAVNTVSSTGTLQGDFKLFFDQEALFTMAGVIVMLPENRIMEVRKRGEEKDARDMSDAIGETGNLLVGSWDRIFRAQMPGHGHFLQTNSYIGTPWDNAGEKIGLNDTDELIAVNLAVTIEPYPTFGCAAVFPKSIFDVNTESVGAPADISTEAEPETTAVESDVVDDAPAEETLENLSDVADPVDSETPEQIAAQAGDEVEAEAAENNEKKVDQDLEIGEEKVEVAVVSDAKELGPISSTIKKMSESEAYLPGQRASSMLTSGSSFFNLTAKDVMNPNVLWISPDDSVGQAQDMMQQHDAKYLIVGNKPNMEALLSHSDVSAAMSIYLRPMFSKWRRPQDDATLKIKVKWIATTAVNVAREAMPLDVLVERMCRFSVRALPIINAQGEVRGMVTANEIFKALRDYAG